MSDVGKTFIISFFTSLATAVIVYVFMSGLENRVRLAARQPPVEPAVVVAAPATPTVAPVLLPDLTGAPIAMARTLLAERGLHLVLETAAHDARVPADHVLQHEPRGGSQALPGTEVRVVLSRGPALIVPQVVGRNLIEARTLLRDAGFRTGEETRIEATAPVDEVIAQTPAAGAESAAGASVALTVSRGPALAEVPNVRKRRVGVARKTLEDAGFVPGALTWTNNQDYEPGVIVRQQPAGGTRAPRGSEVRLWGSEPE